jgi:uncharacterized protein (TIGR00661 family)
MNILYAIQSYGMGHAMRSKQVIEYLNKKHTIVVASAGKAKEIFDKTQQTVTIAKLHFHYEKNTVSYAKTTAKVISESRQILQSIQAIRKIIREKKINAVITDFEPICAYAAKLEKIPLIEIDNIKSIPYLPDKTASWRRAINILTSNILIPNPTKLIITSDFTLVNKPASVEWIPSILRPQITKLKTTKGTKILVYQASHTDDEKLITTLNKTPFEYVYFGCQTQEKRGNVFCKTFNQDEFLSQMAQAKAIICNGGYTVISEAMYLRKPVLICPIKNQYEQELNGKYVESLQIGKTVSELTAQNIQEFNSSIPVYETAYRQTKKRIDPLKKIEKILVQIGKEYG